MCNGNLDPEIIPIKMIKISTFPERPLNEKRKYFKKCHKYLWEADVEPGVEIPESENESMKKSSSIKKIAKRKIKHVPFEDDLFPEEPSLTGIFGKNCTLC